jgi:pimeloyl-ACP methyl ester carboxylesterase
MVMVDAGGYQVYATIQGGDNPPVVAVSAQGSDATQWAPVVDRLSSDPQLITYDRPGIGRSAPRPAPNLAAPYRTFADELATMLDTSGSPARSSPSGTPSPA